ncbi:MAG: lipid-A-disaccharide synthase [Desulfobulbus propionicus]|nr:MAG: lipid-A-disaccharide synthase [Desulfobulbus propionicus]
MPQYLKSLKQPGAAPHIMISAGEASGDIHGANLFRSIKKLLPDITCSGMGGNELQRAGVNVVFDAASIAVVGASEIISHLKNILLARKMMIKEMTNNRPALLILVDFPDFNLLLAAQAKKMGVPVFYYISPQVWAWRTGRMKKIGLLSQRVATILPFEQDFYKQHGYTVDYVGHPLLDTVIARKNTKAVYRQYGIPGQNRCIGLLPGSRKKEIQALLPTFLEVAYMLDKRHEQPYTFLLPKASTIDLEILEELGIHKARQQMDIRVINDHRYDLMAACDIAIAASGTVTLELAILETPAIVAYRVSPLTYLTGRLLIRNIDYFSLANLIVKKEIMPEFLQHEVTAENLYQACDHILTIPGERDRIVQEFRKVKKMLGETGASKRAAAIVIEMLKAVSG